MDRNSYHNLERLEFRKWVAKSMRIDIKPETQTKIAYLRKQTIIDYSSQEGKGRETVK